MVECMTKGEQAVTLIMFVLQERAPSYQKKAEREELGKATFPSYSHYAIACHGPIEFWDSQ